MQLTKIIRLRKELRLFDVYAIATGTTLSAGFFLLPGLAAVEAGPAIVFAYLLAAVPLIPAMFSIIELATAMPRAGGMYYFLDRTLGPLFGTIGGIGTWLALVLKVSFALVGMGAYLSVFLPELPITPVALILAVVLGILNLFSTKKSGSLQIVLVILLLIILIVFIIGGVPEINFSHFQNFWQPGFSSILATSGLVFISYVGVTKVASLSEEVKNPERNLPLGIILALSTSILIYIFGITVIVGVLPIDELKSNLTPVASAAEIYLGKFGAILPSIAALLAFISVANAGTMSASRYPLAMSRDHLMPAFFRKLGKRGTPVLSILFTVAVIVIILLLLDPTGIAKLASTFQLLMFALACFAVIVMRESRIDSYDPGYHSPFYPWMQIIGIIIPLIFIFEMGMLPLIFSFGLIITAIAWFMFYARDKVTREGAIYHIFERLGRRRYGGLDSELRGILKEKGLRKEDPFDEIVTRSRVINLNKEMMFEEVVEIAADELTSIIPCTREEIKDPIMEGTRIGATPVTHGVALPHFRTSRIERSEMVLVRANAGVRVKLYDPLTHKEEEEQIVYALFFLVSPENNPSQHLRILAQIAGRVDEESFLDEWKSASSEQELKEALLHEERFLSLTLKRSNKTSELINKQIHEIPIPEGCLVAMISRGEEVIIPKGSTVFYEEDRLTVIGDPKGIGELQKLYLE